MSRLSMETVARLSVADRLALIGQLWDSLEDTDVQVSAARRAELDRRLAEAERGDDALAWALAWEKFRTALDRRFG